MYSTVYFSHITGFDVDIVVVVVVFVVVDVVVVYTVVYTITDIATKSIVIVLSYNMRTNFPIIGNIQNT